MSNVKANYSLCYNSPNRSDLLTFLKDIPAIYLELSSYCEEVA